MKRTATQSGSQNELEVNTKKSRQGRRNDKQLTFMVDYMVQNPHVATGKFHSLNGKNALAGSWEDLVSSLNDLRNPGVKEKNIKSWKESWRDLKTKVSKKASTLRNARSQTGNKKIDLFELSDMEKKVLGIVGFDYVEETECPDSWPEELLDDVELLAKGDNSILNVVPTPLTIRPHQDTCMNDNTHEINNDPYYTIEVLKDDIMEDNSEQTSPLEINKSHILINVPDKSSRSLFAESSIGYSSARQPILSTIPTTNLKKKKRDVKLSTQFTNAREVFTNLAKTNNQQFELLTTSINKLAESNTQMAAAITKMAENDERRLSTDEKLVTLLSTVISKLK